MKKDLSAQNVSCEKALKAAVALAKRDLSAQNVSCEKALKIVIALRKKGHTMEHIARSLGNPELGYDGPSVWTVQRWINGKTKMTKASANVILKLYDKK